MDFSLLDSFDSEIEPEPVEELLSAQARTEYVPAEVKVCDLVAGPLSFGFRADIVVEVRSVTVPPPLVAVATWKKLEKLVPVDASPMFWIVEERVTGTLTVAVVGVGEEATRSGKRDVDTVTVTFLDVEPQSRVNVLVTLRETV